ncbi:uracil-DNA glycosylase [Colwelliaceae bacterium 6441]
MSKILPQWQAVIEKEQQQDYFIDLQLELIKQRNRGEIIFPKEEDVFNAFQYCDLKEINVVIIGQDPYHGVGKLNQPQAHGLAFSVNPGIKVPPSLVNIYKELSTDISGFITPDHGYLINWAKQGVLLINTVLTVKQGQAHSHAKLGWETFTDRIIDEINQQNSGCVFLLWGSHAQKKGQYIDHDKHGILKGPHPSPLSAYRGFFGCQHFSKANQWLTEHNRSPIDWTISLLAEDKQQTLF